MPNGNNLTTSEFILRAQKIHGCRYDYSKVNYTDKLTHVVIICPSHGEFSMRPTDHIGHKRGCPMCGRERMRSLRKSKLVLGVGINDVPNVRQTTAYRYWFTMLRRCYEKKYQDKYPTYKECSVCEEWHTFSNFKKWFDNPENGYQEGYQLDKDILVKGNKIYSPKTCCFVPNRLNTLILLRKRSRGNYPIGVSRVENSYIAQINTPTHKVHLGYFNTPEKAFAVYKAAKEAYIKEIATEYFSRGEITQKAYNALVSYTFDITD